MRYVLPRYDTRFNKPANRNRVRYQTIPYDLWKCSILLVFFHSSSAVYTLQLVRFTYYYQFYHRQTTSEPSREIHMLICLNHKIIQKSLCNSKNNKCLKRRSLCACVSAPPGTYLFAGTFESPV